MYACLCVAVSTSEVRAAIAEGAMDLDAVGRACGAGTGCGSCRERLRDMLDEAAHPSRLRRFAGAFRGRQVSDSIASG